MTRHRVDGALSVGYSSHMLKIVRGDLFDSGADVIGHGVNLQGVMGAGIAATFAAKYPNMYQSYRSACKSGMLQLGYTYMYANPEDDQIVANIATQQFAGKNAQLWAVGSGIEDTLRKMYVADLETLGLPEIGCGIGGLEWKFVRQKIEDLSVLYPHIEITVYQL